MVEVLRPVAVGMNHRCRGVYPRQPRRHRTDARFLADLPDRGVCGLLARIHDPGHRCRGSVVRPFDEQHVGAAGHDGRDPDEPERVVPDPSAQVGDELGDGHGSDRPSRPGAGRGTAGRMGLKKSPHC